VIQLLFWLIDMATTVWVVAMVASLLWGLVRFLIAAPAAIREDLENARRRRESLEPSRGLRYVENEAERLLSIEAGDDQGSSEDGV